MTNMLKLFGSHSEEMRLTDVDCFGSVIVVAFITLYFIHLYTSKS